jgi:hypothetical protein
LDCGFGSETELWFRGPLLSDITKFEAIKPIEPIKVEKIINNTINEVLNPEILIGDHQSVLIINYPEKHVTS